jgi:hypothetical protein
MAQYVSELTRIGNTAHARLDIARSMVYRPGSNSQQRAETHALYPRA